MGESVLIKHLQDKDYDEIENALVDAKASPVSLQEMAELQSDPDAVLVDNLLPNGKYLQSNWRELYPTELAKKVETRTLDDGHIKPVNQFKVSFDEIDGVKTVQMETYDIAGKDIVIPKLPDHFPGRFIITPDGEKSFIASNLGIWEVVDNKAIKISQSSYEGEKYDDIVARSQKLYGENLVMWNHGVKANPEGNMLSYISNKYDIENNHNGIFVFDLTTNTEKILVASDSVDYNIVGWLDEDTMLSKVLQSGKPMSYAAVNLDGEIIPLDLEGKSPYVCSFGENIFAYAEYNGSNQIHIAKFTGSDGIKELAVMNLDGSSRFKPGINGFSPDYSKFICLYVPEDKENISYIQVLDLNTSQETFLTDLPAGSEYILEASWVDNETLLIVTGQITRGQTEEATWTYKLEGGSTNE